MDGPIAGTLRRWWRFIWQARVGQMRTIQIRAVIFKENNHLWVAQCLDHDIAVQGDNRESLINNLSSTLVSYVELARKQGHEPFAGIPEAPRRFFEMFARAHEMANRTAPIEISDSPSIVPEIRVLENA